MRCRITDPKNKDYKNYGGRGLTIEWSSYLDFKRDMYRSWVVHRKKYGADTSIDRKDNNKGYSKENCRWATMREQAKNKRSSRYITYKGKTLIIADWARKLNISRQAIRYRLEAGWDVDSIIKTKFKYQNKYDHDKKAVRTPAKIHPKKSG